MTQQQSDAPVVVPGKANRGVQRSRWWKRPFVWIAGVVLIGVGTQLEATIQAYVKAMLSAVGVSEPGPAIEVLDMLGPSPQEAFVLPNGVNEQDVAAWDRRHPPSIDWLNAHGAIPLDEANWEITLVGRRAEAVAIRDMRLAPEGGRCAQPTGGALIENRLVGGPGELLVLVADVDSSDPVLKWHDKNNQLQPFFAKNSLFLPAGEKNTLIITAKTKGSYCRWTLEVEYLADGDRRKMTITAPEGHPFTVTGRVDPSQYESVFLRPERNCKEPYLQVSGPEYAEIPSNNPGYCPLQ